MIWDSSMISQCGSVGWPSSGTNHCHCAVKEVGGDGDGDGDDDETADLEQWHEFVSHGGHLLVAAVKDTVLVSIY